jgi:hypothetical protein
LYFGKGKFGGKKFTLQKSEFYFAKEFFPKYYSWNQIEVDRGVFLSKFFKFSVNLNFGAKIDFLNNGPWGNFVNTHFKN